MPSPTSRTVGYQGRAARRGRHDPFQGLAGTHNLGISTANVDTDVIFPDRSRWVTFNTRIQVTGASATGIVFSFGNTLNGVKLAVSGGKLYVAAGNATPASNDGVDGSVTRAALGEIGSVLALTVAIRPEVGKLRLWIGSTLALRLDAASSTAMLDSQWANVGDGSVGVAEPAGGSTQRIGVAVNGAPADFKLTTPLRVAMGQIPRQFDA